MILLIAGTTTLLASVGMNLQIRANSQLAMEGVPPTRIALVNMGIQISLVVIAALLSRRIRTGAVHLVTAIRQRRVRAWWFVGGIVGASVITSMGVVGPLVGVAVFSIAIVAGQTTSSLAVDRWGLGPGGRRLLSSSRVLAALIAIGAVILSVSDRIVGGTAGDLAWGAVLIALIAGLGISFQSAGNGQLARVSGQPAIGAGVNFAVGVTALVIIGPFIPATGDVTQVSGVGIPWLYFGAVFGLLVVLNAAWAVKYLGILVLTVIGVLGQMAGALAVDIVFPTDGVTVTPALLAGLVLAVVAVVVGTSSQWRRRALSAPNEE